MMFYDKDYLDELSIFYFDLLYDQLCDPSRFFIDEIVKEDILLNNKGGFYEKKSQI